ncbi:MAG: hypothetical protein DMG96_05265 [Acidobacteria bacterium]|nr:MAG: hypothetical protein DMG96_05265 [Acidobacteriota bacterium]
MHVASTHIPRLIAFTGIGLRCFKNLSQLAKLDKRNYCPIHFATSELVVFISVSDHPNFEAESSHNYIHK